MKLIHEMLIFYNAIHSSLPEEAVLYYCIQLSNASEIFSHFDKL